MTGSTDFDALRPSPEIDAYSIHLPNFPGWLTRAHLATWNNKVEGAKSNTPSKTNTYKRLPITNTLRQTLRPSLRTLGGVRSERGQPSRKIFAPAQDFFEPDRKIVARPAQLRKKHCPCILEGRLTTNPILSALHLQGLKFNIYVPRGVHYTKLV
jgi:hypothetical protein